VAVAVNTEPGFEPYVGAVAEELRFRSGGRIATWLLSQSRQLAGANRPCFGLTHSWCVRAIVVVLLINGFAPAWGQTPTPAIQTLRIVGGLAGLNQYTKSEEPFWLKDLPRLSGGKYVAEIVPFDRAGVPGPEMLRLMEYGVVPFGTALISNISGQNPEFAAPDLAGLNPNLAALRKNLAAYRPYMEKILRDQHSVELLAVYTYPAQVIFCKNALKNLSDLAGRKIRVSSATQSDFVSGLGATPVLMGLAQVNNSVKSGKVDCAITGSMSGNTLGLHAYTSFLHEMPITWGLAIFGANLNAWQALPGDLRALLSREIPKLEAAIWNESERETGDGLACNRGGAQCQSGHKGTMTEVGISPQDDVIRKTLFEATVLPNWLRRCNGRCAEIWNQTIAISSGVRASTSP
jgi:TRAP-type C4-dicarboxylate transport system substrate-binding protein